MATITVRNLKEDIVERLKAVAEENGRSMEPVSYTHLTLPTIYSV